jgi:hypothetical protein
LGALSLRGSNVMTALNLDRCTLTACLPCSGSLRPRFAELS